MIYEFEVPQVEQQRQVFIGRLNLSQPSAKKSWRTSTKKTPDARALSKIQRDLCQPPGALSFGSRSHSVETDNSTSRSRSSTENLIASIFRSTDLRSSRYLRSLSSRQVSSAGEVTEDVIFHHVPDRTSSDEGWVKRAYRNYPLLSSPLTVQAC